jgi:hypothetical protein
MLDGIGKAGAFLTLGRRGFRPALGGLRNMLNAHSEMKPSQFPPAWCCRKRQRDLAERRCPDKKGSWRLEIFHAPHWLRLRVSVRRWRKKEVPIRRRPVTGSRSSPPTADDTRPRARDFWEPAAGRLNHGVFGLRLVPSARGDKFRIPSPAEFSDVRRRGHRFSCRDNGVITRTSATLDGMRVLA